MIIMEKKLLLFFNSLLMNKQIIKSLHIGLKDNKGKNDYQFIVQFI